MVSGKDETSVQGYAECLRKLYGTHSLKLGLERTKVLSECFGNPGDTYKTVHVAGTNGKGSVSHKISMCLRMRNYKVGLFTSPHVFSIRERMKVNDECICQEEFVSLVQDVLKKAEELDMNPTFFEIITIVAFLFFKSKKVDYAVIETGIGGRLDATNILKKPELVVITSIGYDHQQLLGDHLNSICEEKIGIIKDSTNVIIGPSVSIYKSVFNRAKDLNCVLHVVPPEPRGESFNEENTRIATEALKILKVNISSDPILKTVVSLKPPLRMQYLAIEQVEHVKKKISPSFGISTNANAKSIGTCLPLAVILDVGHNETAINRLCQEINYFHKGKPIRVCVSATRPRSLAIFQPLVAHFQGFLQDILYLPCMNERTYDFCEVSNMLSKDEQITQELRGHLLRSAEKVTSWLENARKEDSSEGNLYTRGIIPLIVKNAFLNCCQENSILLICGTFFMFEEVLAVLDIHSDLQDPISMNEPSST
ncbi:dihydrofolate synthase/folylpolyglutamate synthase, putative [Plasmodium knowlesi strain H]|uniref:Dihydrofolate synthase/folylpolyglutamate synthase, putative n=3 Tax=Plasmodium knowlesi TaxID=5850 RepID=A0A5K1U4A0_PLAKH|nr:dihydrofolate synthase/folylpolyglutamate synthase, putative [Plasmodium knowlesi strain H]OTN65698.1 putative Dihydrofolate synthase/folylpolyglutamate synthase [Plasmodium knowlesi]CAA9989366.1 dihydrofolate synthase/folylpolyglutamate synthase, putative [Plasmodium knowlesi strain H]SBO24943.1 dihydrofolate synthase/folylpolyglutamate synthase, putative [Plasmodium knowlesi strain H]SBO27906.1 dihydrofolate synthase/folylpolyglutamate synthase, putative [Plasmodium knowlesi strain H]VVS7|eukprot:XP_002260093.1 dihydrofolate synthase/folylpolyglutamate synthase, putative [Plasmodium knowlesi strain H]